MWAFDHITPASKNNQNTNTKRPKVGRNQSQTPQDFRGVSPKYIVTFSFALKFVENAPNSSLRRVASKLAVISYPPQNNNANNTTDE